MSLTVFHRNIFDKLFGTMVVSDDKVSLLSKFMTHSSTQFCKYTNNSQVLNSGCEIM